MTRARWIGVLGLLLIIGAGLSAGPVIEHQATTRLHRLLAQRGIESSWSDLRWSFRDGLAIDQLSLSQAGAQVVIDHLQIKLDLLPALRGRVRPTQIELGVISGHLDLAQVQQAASGGSSIGSEGLASLLSRSPSVQIKAMTLDAQRGDAPLGALHLNDITVQVDSTTITAFAKGQCALTDERLPADGPCQVHVDLDLLSMDLSMGMGKPDTADHWLTWAQGGRTLTLDGIALEGNLRTRHIDRLGVDGVRGEGRLGPFQVDGAVDSVRVSTDDGWQVDIAGGSVHAIRTVQETGGTSSGKQRKITWPTGLQLALRNVQTRVELGEGRPAFEGTLVEARSDGITWHAELEALDGRAVIDFETDPWQRQVHWASANLDGLDLGAAIARIRRPKEFLERRRPSVGGHISGDVIVIEEAQSFFIAGMLSTPDGLIDIDGLSAIPLDDVMGRVEGFAHLNPDAGTLFLSGHLGNGPLQADLTMDVQDWPHAPTLEVWAKAKTVGCADAWRALPASLRGPYLNARLSGQLAPLIHLRMPTRTPKRLKLTIHGLLGVCTVHALNAKRSAWPDIKINGVRATDRIDDVNWLDAAFVKRVYEGVRRGKVFVGPGMAGYVPLNELPEYVGAVAFLSEEVNFYNNSAISTGLITRALRLNLAKGRFVYGGSTVTQQLVKNLFLTRDKTLVRKFREAVISARIVDKISKNRVLELYLNCIEFGPEVYGIGAAAQYYFQKNARQLTPKEAIFLAMLKPSPRQGGYIRRRGWSPNYPWWRDRFVVLMKRLVEKGFLTPEQAEAERPYTLYWQDKRYLPAGPELATPYDDSGSDESEMLR